MLHKIFLTFLLVTSLLAMDVETIIDNASEDEANVIINPITGKEYNIYTTYDITAELIELSSSGKLNVSIEAALDAIKEANPNHVEKFNSANFIEGLIKNSMNMDYNFRKDIISYANSNIIPEEKNRIEYDLIHLEIGTDLVSLQSTSIENLIDHFYGFSDDIDINEVITLLDSRSSEIPESKIKNLLASLLYRYLDKDADASKMKSLITNLGIDISEMACEQVRQDLSWLHEDYEYPGTLETIKTVKEQEPEVLKIVMERYETNIVNSAYTLNKLAKIGIPKETKCDENETLFDVLANDEYFDPKDITKELKKLTPSKKIEQIFSPCASKSTIELFKMCDIASIIWHLEKIERLDVKNKQIFNTGDNVGDCEAFFETKLMHDQKITNLKVIHMTGSEASLEASPKSLINYISK